MGKLFGTDGVRGVAGKDLTCELALQIGRATAAELTSLDGHRPRILIGKDTRVSGDMLECTLAAGLCSVGADVDLLGVIPTPGVAYLVRKYGADAGIVISASHNPMEFNGIKFFDGNGYKLPDALEDEIEALIKNNMNRVEFPTGSSVGRIKYRKDAREEYINHAVRAVPVDLTNLKVVVDCAEGASHYTSIEALRQLGAQVVPIHNMPDGTNINANCGSTHMEELQARVVYEKANIGLAFDGDADRLLAVDELGNVVDGDQIMAIVGAHMRNMGKLKQNTIVATVMSNLGLFLFGEKEKIHIEKTKVGDRYVLERMREIGASLGGEQSGHIIFSKYAATGDGLITAIKMMEVMVLGKQTLSQLRRGFVSYPQKLTNVRVMDKAAAREDADVQAAVARITEELGDRGRILVRESGTEPLIRVMVEASDPDDCEKYVDQVVEVLRKNAHIRK